MNRKYLPLIIAAVVTFFAGCKEKNATSLPSTPAQKLAAAFVSKVKADKSIDLETLATSLVQNDAIPFGPAVMPVEPGYLNGFSSEITGFSSGVFFGPMIGSIPFAGYVFKVQGNAESFIKTLKDNADLRWNVCTQADEMVAESVGDIVFFVMAPKSFDEE